MNTKLNINAIGEKSIPLSKLQEKVITPNNIEDSIKDLSVKDLTGVIEATPEEFNFRPSAGDKSIRDESAVIRSIKGNSLVWNQLAHEYGKGLDVDKWTLKGGVTNYGFDNGILSIVFENSNYAGVSQKVPNDGRIRHNDKILNIQKIRYSGDKELRVISPYISVTSNKLTPLISGEWSISWGISTIPSYADLNDVYIGCRLDGTITSGTLDIEYSSFYNLTKMFGAGNEPSTIEEFYARIPSNIDIYAYNEGEIINNNVEGIKTVGFNQWDEEWELGNISPLIGVNATASNSIRSKDYIPIIGGQSYYFYKGDGGEMGVFAYDSNYNFIGVYTKNTFTPSVGTSNITNKSIALPSNARYIKFRVFPIASPTYNHDICINLSHSGIRNGEYEPYKENYRALPDIKKYFPDGMKSAGSVYDEITSEKAIQRVGVVDLGSLSWRYNDNLFGTNLGGGFYAYITNSESTLDPHNSNILSSNLTVVTADVMAHNAVNKTICKYNALFVRDTDCTDVNQFVSAYQGVMLYYELAEPIETPLEEPIQLDYVVEDWGTEEAISNEPSAPFKADIVYQFNAEGRIRDNSRNIEILENNINSLKNSELNLSVKDNGNIVLSNKDGQSKEFMPATPSGDPMHYAYVDAGAAWSSSTGYWSLNGLTDITNEQMRKIYNVGFIHNLAQGPLSGLRASIRTNLLRIGASNYQSEDNLQFLALENETIEVINFKNSTGSYESEILATSFLQAFDGCTALREIYGRLASGGSFSNAFRHCTSLQRVRISDLNTNLDLSYSPLIDKESIVYAITKAKPTNAISITLHADAYDRLENDGDVLAALEAQPLISLISA